MLTDFQNSVTDRLSNKVLVTKSHIKRVATLPCEIVVLKIAMILSCVKRTENSVIQNICRRIFTQWC